MLRIWNKLSILIFPLLEKILKLIWTFIDLLHVGMTNQILRLTLDVYVKEEKDYGMDMFAFALDKPL